MNKICYIKSSPPTTMNNFYRILILFALSLGLLYPTVSSVPKNSDSESKNKPGSQSKNVFTRLTSGLYSGRRNDSSSKQEQTNPGIQTFPRRLNASSDNDAHENAHRRSGVTGRQNTLDPTSTPRSSNASDHDVRYSNIGQRHSANERQNDNAPRPSRREEGQAVDQTQPERRQSESTNEPNSESDDFLTRLTNGMFGKKKKSSSRQEQTNSGANGRQNTREPTSTPRSSNASDHDVRYRNIGQRQSANERQNDNAPRPSRQEEGQAADQTQPERRRGESTSDLVKNVALSSVELTTNTAKLAKKTAVWVHNKTAKPDIKKVIALAQATASYVGTAASLGGEVAMSAGKHLWPPVRRSTKKYILPTVAVLGRHTVPITMALAKSAYSNANALRPHVGRVVKPAWRVARDRAVKPSWRLSRELVMKPLYNRAVLPTMKRGAQKVLQWNEWEPELEQQQQGQQQQQQNVDAFSSAAEEEEEGHKNSGRKATTNEPNIFDKLGDDKWARRRKD